MRVQITGRHIDITDTLRAHVENKVGAALADYPRLDIVHVILDHEKHRKQVEIVVHAPNRAHVEAKAETDDLYASLDEALGKAERQMRKWNEKIHDHKKAPLSDVDARISRAHPPA